MNPWLIHVKATKKKHPELIFKDVLVKAKSTYTNKTQAKTKTIKGGLFMKSQLDQPKAVTKFLKKYGDKKITGLIAYRKPIQSLISKALNILTMGSLASNMKKLNYDNLYHLYVIISLEGGPDIAFQKNQRVIINKAKNSDYIKDRHTVIRKGFDQTNLTLNELVNNAEKYNPNLYLYTATQYNCQNFVMSLINGSNIPIQPEPKKFILQEVDTLLSPLLSKTANVATDLAASADILLRGGSKKMNKKEIDKEIKRLEKQLGIKT